MVEIISDEDSIGGDIIKVGRTDEGMKERELIERIDNLRYRKKMEEDIKKRRQNLSNARRKKNMINMQQGSTVDGVKAEISKSHNFFNINKAPNLLPERMEGVVSGGMLVQNALKEKKQKLANQL